ncbi:uncharacterized protein LOC110720498 [Chenopodium quinoa]|uniref:uncharacterized protein LOC110720498 n=1 Tax=Chenopodium quinoa TaxID=63459 RepID=UPI000B7802D9|nr:uncharacterized protein LOC110720498 [Chenopodium quinoa]
MRGRIGLFMNPSSVGSTTIGRTSKLVFCSAFSSAGDGSGGGGGGGGGRGRGRGAASGSPAFNFVAGMTGSNEGLDDSDESSPHPAGRGHGTSFRPSYNGFVAPNPPGQQLGLSRGRGGPVQQAGNEEDLQPKRPIFLKKDESTGSSVEAESVASMPRQPIGEKNFPENILNVLGGGSGRGTIERRPVVETRAKEENRHLRPRQQIGAPPSEAGRGRDRSEKGDTGSAGVRRKLTKEELEKAKNRAVGILSKDDDGKEGGRAAGGGDRRRRVRRLKDDSDEEMDEDDDENFAMGDDADGEKLAKALGPSRMAELSEAFEDMSTDVLPDPEDDEYLEALDTNLKIELEPEYLMGDFETNPDINENPPIPLRDALEKMKPFLMAYEEIENEEEWEEIMKETMEKVPLFKEIVDHYCGPDTVTAKQQHEELQRVAKTLPPSAPNSVKHFADRAVLSLQSNPGWGFHRKCQFMDKLVLEISKSYK